MSAATTLRTLMSSTPTCFFPGRQATGACSPNPSSLPGSVSSTPAGTGRYGEGSLPGVASPPLAADVPSCAASPVGEPEPDEPSPPLQAASTRAATSAATAREARLSTGSATDQALGEVRRHLVEGNPLLLHGVPLADGDGVVVEGVEVDRHAVGRADLVLAPVAAADGARVVEVDVPAEATQCGGEVLGLRAQVGIAAQRQDRDLDRREARVELEHDALVDATLGVGRLVLGVGVHEERHHRPVRAERRLDHVGDVALTGGLVEVREVLAGVLAVLLEVEVGAAGDALELLEAALGEAEVVLDVDGPLGVVAELLPRVLVLAQVVRADAEVGVPAGALVDPVLVPLLVGAGLDELLHLHLLELARAEDEVAGRDLVAEALADLGDAERRLLAGAGHDVLEVQEDALRRLRAQVVQAGLVLDHPEVGLEHHVEVARLGPCATGAAVGAGELGEVDRVGVVDALPGGVVLLHVVGPEPLVARLALGQRVRERGEVAGGLPGLRRQDHAGVQADDVLAGVDHGAPPLTLDVL